MAKESIAAQLALIGLANRNPPPVIQIAKSPEPNGAPGFPAKSPRRFRERQFNSFLRDINLLFTGSLANSLQSCSTNLSPWMTLS